MLYIIATVLTVAILFFTMDFSQGVWLLASAFLFLNISFETSLRRRTLVLAAVGAAALAWVFIGSLAASMMLVQAVLLTLATGYCIYMTVRHGQTAYPWFAANVLGVMAVNSDGTVTAALSHAEAVLISLGVVLAGQIILLPFFARDEYRWCKKRVLHRLSRLSENIFACLISSGYVDNLYLFERRIHKQKIKCLTRMALLAQREQAAASSDAAAYKMQKLFEMLLDIGQIRRRVTDHTVFALCVDEMKGIDHAIRNVFAALAGHDDDQQDAALTKLEKYVTQLESTFEHVLRVTAREPLVFVLMLAGLKELIKECREQWCVGSAYAEVTA